jgi:predicted transcriptional regulator
MSRTLTLYFDTATQELKSPYRKKTDTLIFYRRGHFQRFVKNLDLIETIKSLKPQSTYALAKHLKKDVANIAKITSFYEELGLIRSKISKSGGRTSKNMWVDYDQIVFQLGATRNQRPGPSVLGLARRRV